MRFKQLNAVYIIHSIEGFAGSFVGIFGNGPYFITLFIFSRQS